MSTDSRDQSSTTFKVAKVIDEYTLVLNKGSAQGVKSGQRFLVYQYGEEILDPDGAHSLGSLEIVKGTGRVTHLQQSMATIRSDMTSLPQRSIRKIKRRDAYSVLFPSGMEEVEEVLPAETVPFVTPVIGDHAKPV